MKALQLCVQNFLVSNYCDIATTIFKVFDDIKKIFNLSKSFLLNALLKP